MAGIKAGDDGTVLEMPITDGGAVVPLTGASVSIVIKQGERRVTKTASITDAVGGLCELVLTGEDVAYSGVYSVQAVVTMPNGDDFASDIEKFTVGKRI